MEDAYKIINQNGKFQKILIFILISTSFLSSVLSVSYSYLTKHPLFECSKKNQIDSPYSQCEYRNGEFCDKNSGLIYRKIYDKSLHNWSYSFDLYCNNEHYIPLIGSSFFFGGILGSILITPLPDKFGRKKIFNSLTFISCLMHINLLFSNNPFHIVIICFISGFCYAIYGIFGVIMYEFLPNDKIGIIMTYSNAIYPLAGVFLAFFFIYINNWRVFFGFTSFLHIITTYLSLKYFTESPKWLINQGKINECINELNSISYINNTFKEWDEYIKKKKNDIFNLKNLSNSVKKKNSSSIYQKSFFVIISLPSQRKTILILILLWYASSFCFYGIILNLNKLKGEFFSLSILAFLGEMLSELISGYAAEIYGRVLVLKYGGFLGGFGFLLYKIVPMEIKAILIFISMFGFSATFNVIYIYTAEILPISIKGSMSEFLFLLSRFAPFCVPILSELIGDYIDFIFILMGISYGIACFGLNETLGKVTTEDIPESNYLNSKDSSFEYDNISEFSLISSENDSHNFMLSFKIMK